MTRWTAPILAAAAVAAAATALAAQETGLTIYSDGRVIIRRTLPVAVPRGVTTMAVDLGVRDADPTSLVALDEGVQLRLARVSAALGLEGSLRRSLGREVTFRTGPDSAPRYVRGTLLSLEPPAVRLDGMVMYGLPGTPVFPDSLVQLLPRIEVTLESARPLNALRLMYLSGGLGWQASYTIILPRGGAGQGTVTGAATIVNGASLALTGAQVQLLAGDVRRAGQPPPMARAPGRAVMEMSVAAAEPAEEALGGTHLYSLPGTVDFAPGETRTIALFPRATATVEPEFVLRGQNYGPANEWPDALRDLHPEIAYRVLRPAGPAGTAAAAGSFGATPLPGGVVRVYEPDEAGRPQLVGEAAIGHTPAGRDLRLATGTAFDITATRTQTAFERRGPRETVSDYRVALQNARPQAVQVLVTDMCPGRCDVLSSSTAVETGSATTVAFRVSVPAGGSATLDYRLRARW